MKRLIALAFTVFALAAVPAAFADDGATPPTGGTPAAAAPAPATQDAGQGGQRLEKLRLRIQKVEARFAKHCAADASDAAKQRCTEVATKVEDRLTKLEARIQDRIQKIQAACTATSTDPKCKNAAARVARLQIIDGHVQALAQQVQDWLDGKPGTQLEPTG